MNKKFYEKKFDDATQVKLDVFRRYLQEWLPVFPNKGVEVSIYDFFAGPGKDAAGNLGSSLIIVEELKQFCEHHSVTYSNVSARVVFNDIEEKHIKKLKKHVCEIACGKACCKFEYSAKPFRESLEQHLMQMRAHDTANLVFMDQFGIKEVTPEVVGEMAKCSRTDILFFISSSIINRFIETQEIGGKFDISSEALKDKEYTVIHRYLCEHFREKLGGLSYYLAPFSIKKGGNIYGIIFGSGHILGLEKFLTVCWSLDKATGEANYNIDGDLSWGGQKSLFEELNTIRKVDLFEKDLLNFIHDYKPDNIALNEFCLQKGFSPSRSNEVLRGMQSKGSIKVWDITKDKPARKNSFYLGWNNVKTASPRVIYTTERAT
ncbi:MAG: three-Cys-motif partner protein TcmP [Deltaproteobacteria bacterium]|nr:three-Cys-motif partner protein TcmP [Deltaproteobacteria bacterium]